MNISPKGANLIKEFEGMRLVGYLCPAGIPTVGLGHTGPEVKRGMKITEAQAWAYFHKDIQKFERGVLQALAGAPVTQSQFDAMVSLAFNIGVGAFARSSVLRNHKAKRYTLAANSFLLWVKAGAKTLPGLVRRRQAERKLYLS